MKKSVRAITISGNGTNCEIETAFAFKLAGAEVSDIVHISRIVAGDVRLDDYHILALAGGFLDGDDLGAAKAMANRVKFAHITGTGRRLLDEILGFVEAGKLIIGICNGFQLMVKIGLLPALGGTYGTQSVTITNNDSGRFEDRWVRLFIEPDCPSIFTRGIRHLTFPVRHGEGKFVAPPAVLSAIEAKHLVVARYADENYTPTMSYPLNPNGSLSSVAGICDQTGRLMALMPHPEGYLFRSQHPTWTRGNIPEEGMGLMVFKNAVTYVRENLIGGR
ncbi:MAG: phosphoribosylformylglycinamidine synthase subunit PurQ [Deltaproteobacteria bacterium]|nr:phosphoribosylformylglycinamidine synthase subunit PurQ [Candidatus Zymogenaceae bacterium]